MKALVIFGSNSDSRISGPLLASLKEKGIDYDFHIASAHKSPLYLERLLEGVNDRYKVVIAGAGLAAHLPGVIASRTIRPVIGIPVNVNYRGADALLSIMQMPPNVPVLCSGIDGWEEAARNAELIIKGASGANIMNATQIMHEKLEKAFSGFGIHCGTGRDFREGSINICIVKPGDKPVIPDSVLAICVTCADDSLPGMIPALMESSGKGLWVGLNRLENAALAAVQIMGNHTEKLIAQKKEQELMFYR